MKKSEFEKLYEQLSEKKNRESKYMFFFGMAIGVLVSGAIFRIIYESWGADAAASAVVAFFLLILCVVVYFIAKVNK